MNIEKIEFDHIDETMYQYTHKSGLQAFVIPKKGYSKKYATFATHFGSINSEFIIPGTNQPLKVPDGVAHFLEHKLFDQKDGSVMDKFAKLGSNPNAYTGFNQTVYLFSCTELFQENFTLLLNYVQNPYITEESVEKEKGIIGQEIKMYEDNPNWRAFFNLLKAMYKQNPVRADIAGTIESIGRINKDTLYKCYNTFYDPSNMVILIVGDVDPVQAFEMVENGIVKEKGSGDIKRIFPKEESGINESFVEQALAVSLPLFQMGFKEIQFNPRGKYSLMYETAVKLLLNMIMGKSSELYDRLYTEGLINNTFETDYTIEENYAFSIFGGESQNPERVRSLISDEIRAIQARGLDETVYERIKKAMKGRFLKQLNSVEGISHMFIPAYFKSANMFDYYDVYDKISFKYVKDTFLRHFDLDRLVLSVVKPV